MANLGANLQASANFDVPGFGSAGDMFQQTISGSPNASALSAQLNTYASDPNLSAMASEGAAGIAAATQGKAPTDAQVEGIATGVATAAAVVAGVGITAAAAAIAPLAAVVFGAGDLIGLGIKKAFNITNCGLTASMANSDVQACSGPPRTPGQPGYVTYAQAYTKFRSDNAYLTSALGGDPSKVPTTWQPYTHGAFETAMRPVIIKILELYMNCGALPAVSNERTAMQGVVNMWNAHAPPGTSMRNITWQADDLKVKYPGSFGESGPRITPTDAENSIAWSFDPIQMMMKILFDTWQTTNCHTEYTGKPWPWALTVAAIPVSSPPPAPVVVQKVISLKLHTGGAAPTPSVPVTPILVNGMTVPPPTQPSQRTWWQKALPYAPVALGAALFPFAGVVAPLVGGAASALWVELRK